MKNLKPSYLAGSAVRKEQKVDEKKKIKDLSFKDWKFLMESNRGFRY